MAKKNIDEMSFLDHLEDLRWHLIRATLGVVIAATLAFICKKFIFDVIIFITTILKAITSLRPIVDEYTNSCVATLSLWEGTNWWNRNQETRTKVYSIMWIVNESQGRIQKAYLMFNSWICPSIIKTWWYYGFGS